MGQHTTWMLLAASHHNPALQPRYERLRASGKPAKVTLVALMRQLVERTNLFLKKPSLSLIQ